MNRFFIKLCPIWLYNLTHKKTKMVKINYSSSVVAKHIIYVYDQPTRNRRVYDKDAVKTAMKDFKYTIRETPAKVMYTEDPTLWIDSPANDVVEHYYSAFDEFQKYIKERNIANEKDETSESSSEEASKGVSGEKPKTIEDDER